MYAHWDCELCPWCITFSLRGKLTSLFVCLFLHHSFLLHPLPRLLLPLITHKVQAGKHWTKFWINHLIIPYNITATPNLADIHTSVYLHLPVQIHTCVAYPLCYLWDVADKWQHYSSANPESLARQGVCVCVLQEGGKKSLRDMGRWRGALARLSLCDWLKWTSCRVMDFWQKRWFASTMLRSRLWKSGYFPAIWVQTKYIFFLLYCYFAQRTAAAIKKEARDVKWKIRELKAAKGCNFWGNTACSVIAA